MTKQHDRYDEMEHPMIPVPQAIQKVLHETACSIFESYDNEISLPDANHGNDGGIPSYMERISLGSDLTNLNTSLEDKTSFCPVQSPALGRIIAEAVIMPSPGYPPYDASIMDGYAIDVTSLPSNLLGKNAEIIEFSVIDKVYAGDVARGENNVYATNTADGGDESNFWKAIYVTTGAHVPTPYNAVIPIEDVLIKEDSIAISTEILSKVTTNKWIRQVGCDIPKGTVVISKGCVIAPHHIGLMVQCQMKSVRVLRKPRVGVLSTGNELLLETNTKSKTGQIPDVNRPILFSLLSSYHNCIVTDLGIASDDNGAELQTKLQKAISICDVIITTGGISMGEKDILEEVLVKKLNCQLHFGRLHMKPGKPTTFLTIDRKKLGGRNNLNKSFVFALPGNPVSATVCTELIVRPCLDMMHSVHAIPKSQISKFDDTRAKISNIVKNACVHPEVMAVLSSRVKLDVERPEYHRVTLRKEIVRRKDLDHSMMCYYATTTGTQRSSRLMSMCHADGLMVLPQGRKGVKMIAEPGESYPVLILHRLNGGIDQIPTVLQGTILKDSTHFLKCRLTIGILNFVGTQRNDNIVDGGETLKLKVEKSFGWEEAIIIQSLSTTHLHGIKDIVMDRNKLSETLNIILVICSKTKFQTNLEVTNILRSIVSKESSSLELYAREGAANQDAISALFEPVVGFINRGNKLSMMIGLSESGLEGALGKIKHLLRYAVFAA